MQSFTVAVQFFSERMDNKFFPDILDMLERCVEAGKVPLELVTLLLHILEKAEQEADKWESFIFIILKVFTSLAREENTRLELIEPIFLKMLKFIAYPQLCAESKELIEAYYCIDFIYSNFHSFVHNHFSNNFHVVEMMLSHLANKLPVIRQQSNQMAVYSPLMGVFSALTDCEDLLQRALENNLTRIFRQVISSLSVTIQEDQEVVRQIYCIISATTACSARFVEMVFADREFLAQLLDNMQNAELEIRLETAWSISNSTCDLTIELLRMVLESNIIEVFCSLFNQYPSLKDIKEDIDWSGMFIEAFGYWLKLGEELVDNDLVLYNPVALKLEESGAVETLKIMADYEMGKTVLTEYFGERYDEYLARRRGLKTKRAL